MKIINKFKNKQIKETVWSFLTKGLSLVLFLILNIYLARNLGVEGFGLWSLFFSVITIFSVLSYFGINASANKFIAQHNGTNNLRNVLWDSLKLRIMVSFLFSVLFLFFYKKISLILNKPELESLFFYAVPIIFLMGLVEYLKNVFMGLHRIKYNFIVNFLEFGFKFIFVFLFFMTSISIFSVVKSFILSLLITVSIGFYLLYFNFYKNLKKGSKKFNKEIFNYSIPLFFITFAFLASTEIDTVMIGFFSSVDEVGVYSVAKQIVLKCSHISLIVTMGTMPIFAKLNNGNKDKLKNKFYKILKINIIIHLIIILSIFLLAPFLIPIIFGIQFNNSVLPLQILTIYLAGFSISVLAGSFLDYTGKAKKRGFNALITVILNIFLNLILIPRYGASGAAIATSISSIPYVFLNWLEVKRTLK